MNAKVEVKFDGTETQDGVTEAVAGEEGEGGLAMTGVLGSVVVVDERPDDFESLRSVTQ